MEEESPESKSLSHLSGAPGDLDTKQDAVQQEMESQREGGIAGTLCTTKGAPPIPLPHKRSGLLSKHRCLGVVRKKQV